MTQGVSVPIVTIVVPIVVVVGLEKALVGPRVRGLADEGGAEE
jgi:hypothetical protein